MSDLGQEPASRGSSYAELTPELTRSLRGRASYGKLIFQQMFAPVAPEMECDEKSLRQGLTRSLRKPTPEAFPRGCLNAKICKSLTRCLTRTLRRPSMSLRGQK